MSEETVGIAELRQNLSQHLKRVRSGHRIVVTDHHRPVATLGPPPGSESVLDRLVAEGRVAAPSVPRGPIRPAPLPGADAYAASRALEELRGERL